MLEAVYTDTYWEVEGLRFFLMKITVVPLLSYYGKYYIYYYFFCSCLHNRVAYFNLLYYANENLYLHSKWKSIIKPLIELPSFSTDQKNRAIWLVMPLYIFSGKFAAKLKILLILPYWCGHVIYWALQCLQDTWVLTSLCQLYLIYVYLYIKLFVISLNYIN